MRFGCDRDDMGLSTVMSSVLVGYLSHILPTLLSRPVSGAWVASGCLCTRDRRCHHYSAHLRTAWREDTISRVSHILISNIHYLRDTDAAHIGWATPLRN